VPRPALHGRSQRISGAHCRVSVPRCRTRSCAIGGMSRHRFLRLRLLWLVAPANWLEGRRKRQSDRIGFGFWHSRRFLGELPDAVRRGAVGDARQGTPADRAPRARRRFGRDDAPTHAPSPPNRAEQDMIRGVGAVAPQRALFQETCVAACVIEEILEVQNAAPSPDETPRRGLSTVVTGEPLE